MFGMYSTQQYDGELEMQVMLPVTASEQAPFESVHGSVLDHPKPMH